MTAPTAPPRSSPPARPERAVAAALAAGDRLGVWRITQPLFEVGSGHWFRVVHGLAAAETALALVYRSEADAQAVLMRFAEESEALGRLGSPAYGAPLDCGLSPGGQPYLVVPAMEGAPLMRVAMALPLRRRMELLLDLVALLDAAQARGLVLHELDPGMLWLSPAQQLHWLGQGLAPRGGGAPGPVVRAAEPLADPRQLAGARPDGRSEAHALARLLSLLVNGRLPRAGTTDTVVEASATPVASLQAWMALTAAQRDSLEQLLDRALDGAPVEALGSIRGDGVGRSSGQASGHSLGHSTGHFSGHPSGHSSGLSSDHPSGSPSADEPAQSSGFADRTALAAAVREWLDATAAAGTPSRLLPGAAAAQPGQASAPMPLRPGDGARQDEPSSQTPDRTADQMPDETPPATPAAAQWAERIAGVAALLAAAALLLWLLIRSR